MGSDWIHPFGVRTMLLSACLGVGLLQGQAAWAVDESRLQIEKRLEGRVSEHNDPPGYRDAIEQARSGDAAGAAEVLARLHAAHPEHVRLLQDYIAVLSWADRHDEAVALGRKQPLGSDPVYLLEALARSARLSGDLEFSLAACDALLARSPNHVGARLGKILVFIRQGAYVAAGQLLQPLIEARPDDPEVFDARVGLESAHGDWFRVLAIAEKNRKRFPFHATRARAIALWRLGAPHLAWETLEKSRQYLPQNELRALERDMLAYEVRWGAVRGGTVDGPARFAETDAAIEKSGRLLQRFSQAGAEDDALRVRYDRIVALGDRLRNREVVKEFEALGKEAGEIPAYVRITAGLAYLGLERPFEARDLLSAALREVPDHLEGQLGLYYALLESSDYEGALRQVDALAERAAQWLMDYGKGVRVANPQHLRVLVAGAMARSHTDRQALALKRMDELVERVPGDFSVRNTRAEVWLARGWPRLAKAEQAWILGAEPENFWPRFGHFGAAMQMLDYPEAEAALRHAERIEPDFKPVRDARRDWETHNLRQLRVETSLGRGSGGGNGPSGNRDASVDAHLYSSPLAYHWRAYARYWRASARFDEQTVVRQSAGAGAEYRGPLWSGRIEARAGRNGDSSAGFGLALTPDDFWRLGFDGESRSLETPLRAYDAGIHAHRLAAEAAYRWHESRRVAVGLAGMGFGDGNNRRSLSASWTERVITGPVYMLDVTASWYGSGNSKNNAPYFNPRRDRDIGLTFDNQWLAWRFYRASWRHRLVVTLGNYWQDGFGSGGAGQVRYETAWAPDERIELRLGVAHTWHPYDGVRERRNGLYGLVDWRF